MKKYIILAANIALTGAFSFGQGSFLGEGTSDKDIDYSNRSVQYNASVKYGYDSRAANNRSSAFTEIGLGLTTLGKNDNSFYSFTASGSGSIYYRLNGSNRGVGQFRTSLQYDKRINAALTYSTNTLIAREFEPDYNYGFASFRTRDPHFIWNTYHAIYREVSAVSSVGFSFNYAGVIFDDEPIFNDSGNFRITASYRRKLSPSSTLGFNYSYGFSHNDDRPNSRSHYVTVNYTKRLDPTSVLSGSVSYQRYIQSGSGGQRQGAPNYNITYSKTLRRDLTLNIYSNYTITDFGTAIAGIRRALYTGFRANYVINRDLSLKADFSYVHYDDRNNGTDTTSNFRNYAVGFNYLFSPRFSMYGNFNFTTGSVANILRRRYVLGVNLVF